jgi:hemoglobin-like flavoprotein
MLTQREMDIVQADWAKVELISDVAATLFYDRLFELDPSVRWLFGADMAEQKVKLIRMIGAAVYGLANPEVLLPLLQFLGRKHVSFGVKDEHYATVGAALLWTLRRGLGADFGPDNEAAWTKVYGVLADNMKGKPGGGISASDP